MSSASYSAKTTAQTHNAAARRTYPPEACAFSPSCTVAVVSTIAGLRPLELLDAPALPGNCTSIARSLIPPLISPIPGEERSSINASNTSAPARAAPQALWHTPVYAAAVAEESALVAVVFRARPAVFTPPVLTMATANHSVLSHERGGSVTGPSSPEGNSAMKFENDAAVYATGERADQEPKEERRNVTTVSTATEGENLVSPLSSATLAAPPTSVDLNNNTKTTWTTTTQLLASEADSRRTVHLFDASCGLCLATLHFSGSPIIGVKLNAVVLVVVAADLFHVVELSTLRYVRQQSTHKPLNPRAIIDLSSAIPMKVMRKTTSTATDEQQPPPDHWPQYTYAIAFPQSARGYCGDVTVITMRTTPPSSTTTSKVTAEEAATKSDTEGLSTAATSTSTPLVLQHTIAAHHHAIAHLRLSHDGRLLLTASALGTTLKLFDCVAGVLLVELQRGHRPASVLSLGLQADAYRVAALSANGTLHVFNCAAVVQAWEAVQRGPAAAAAAATFPLSINKARADFKLKVPSLYKKDDSSGAPAMAGSKNCCKKTSVDKAPVDFSTASATNLVSDGSVHYAVGFTAEGRSVWVAQVESTDTQLAFAELQNGSNSSGASNRDVAGDGSGVAIGSHAALLSQRVPAAGQCRRCIGRVIRFLTPLPDPAGLGNVEVEGVSYSIEI